MKSTTSTVASRLGKGTWVEETGREVAWAGFWRKRSAGADEGTAAGLPAWRMTGLGKALAGAAASGGRSPRHTGVRGKAGMQGRQGQPHESWVQRVCMCGRQPVETAAVGRTACKVNRYAGAATLYKCMLSKGKKSSSEAPRRGVVQNGGRQAAAAPNQLGRAEQCSNRLARRPGLLLRVQPPRAAVCRCAGPLLNSVRRWTLRRAAST